MLEDIYQKPDAADAPESARATSAARVNRQQTDSRTDSTRKHKAPPECVLVAGPRTGGIRTHGTLLTYTSFPGVLVRPKIPTWCAFS